MPTANSLCAISLVKQLLRHQLVPDDALGSLYDLLIDDPLPLKIRRAIGALVCDHVIKAIGVYGCNANWERITSIPLYENPSIELIDDDATNLTLLFCASVKKAVRERIVPAIDHQKSNHAKAQKVWYEMKGFAGLPNSSSSIDAILNDIYPFAMKKTSRSVIAKLVLAASTYIIWQEHNNRIFKKTKRSLNQVIECIMNSVRLKLMSCRWKKTRDALEFIRLWKLSEALLQPG
ncbi:sister-chromatid cohesion protein 3 [Tanacetum coccineum]|uniref:Sister-chromatid cohesion protein 3 n=1 Tax=Tanacetum coccineum TaxID=301880 RepID=A0ABQ4WVS7_9ASTR